MTSVARQNEHFRVSTAVFLVAALTPKKKRCFSTQEFTHFLSTGVVKASSHADIDKSSNCDI